MLKNKSHNFNPVILREYDIRGRVGTDFSDKDAYALGLAFGTHLQKEYQGKTVAVGYDGRITSPDLAKSLIKGLRETGINVISVGLGPSPMLYFAVKHLKCDAGIMVTGSHNPPDYNGFKMMRQTASIYGAEIKKIGDIAAKGDFISGAGSFEDTEILNTYIARILEDYAPKRPLKIAWDCGNGAAGQCVQTLVSKLQGQHILLYEDIDGHFPNHHPDPTVDANLKDLINTVIKEKCDLGIAFDGDGDRIGVVDEKGNILRCDHLLAIYAKEVLAENPAATIIGDVKCSQGFFDEVKRLGGNPVMWQCGHSLVKTKMAETNAPLAGELSGHIFFADKYYGFDDGLYCAIRLINLIGQGKNLSDLIAHLPTFHSTPEIRIEVEEREKFNLIPLIKEGIGDNYYICDIDGVRATNDAGWFLIRASNTQNALSLRAEAKSHEALENLKQTVNTLVQGVGYAPPFPQTQEKQEKIA